MIRAVIEESSDCGDRWVTGNVEFQPRKLAYHHDEAVSVKNPEVVQLISELLRVKQETLMAALTAKRARASGETLVINYKFPEVRYNAHELVTRQRSERVL